MNPEFYEDEVIEGFYVPSMLKKAWGAQLDVLKETDRVCREHDIPYFADWGTLLAAIRHGGYIPWDDDIDISMRRRDYERFLEVSSELPDGFKVMNYKNHPGHHFFVARVVGKPRICFEKDHLERFHGFPYIAGLDLYILDNVCADRRREELKAKKTEYVITVADNIADGKTKGREAEEQLRTLMAL
ncbi:MAG: LicD family protein [Lachnospiraceae bacterium]|nr:LicD family protein [Lachnospiraceae bacterium]